MLVAAYGQYLDAQNDTNFKNDTKVSEGTTYKKRFFTKYNDLHTPAIDLNQIRNTNPEKILELYRCAK